MNLRIVSILTTSTIALAMPCQAQSSFKAKPGSGQTYYLLPPSAPKAAVKPAAKTAPKVTAKPAAKPAPAVKPPAQVASKPSAPAPPKPTAVKPSENKRGSILGFFKRDKAPAAAVKPPVSEKPTVAQKPSVPEPKKVIAAAPAKPAVKPKPIETPSAETKKSGTFSKLLGVFRRDEAKPEAPDAPNSKVAEKPKGSETAAAKKSPKEAPPLIKAPETEPKTGFFARIFGSSNKEDSKKDANDDFPSSKPERPSDWESKYIITDDHVEAYRYGPSQARDADEILSKGTVVKLKTEGKSWVEIALADGKIYTVGADQVRKARKDDFADPAPIVAIGAGAPLPLGYYEPAPPPNLPEMTTGEKNLEFPELLLPPLPPQ
jgi:hypothetical protein